MERGELWPALSASDDPRALLRGLFEEVPELSGQDLGNDTWTVAHGGAVGIVRLLPDDEDPLGGRLLVRFQMGRTPQAGAAAYHRRLLELNHGFGGVVAFSVDEDGTAWLSAGRPLAGLDAEGLAATVALAAASAEAWGDSAGRDRR